VTEAPAWWRCRVDVSAHASDRAALRLGWEGEIVQRIRGDVRVALLCDRVSASMPNWVRGNGQEREPDDRTGYWYVWDELATRCWTLVANDDAVLVVTLLVPYPDLSAARERERGVRTGMVRR
jgi:hypothetical protein